MGGRDSCHTITNASLCEWTLRDEGWGVGGVPPSPHSCHRPVTHDVIVPPHLDWIVRFWSVWALVRHLHSDSWIPPGVKVTTIKSCLSHIQPKSRKNTRGVLGIIFMWWFVSGDFHYKPHCGASVLTIESQGQIMVDWLNHPNYNKRHSSTQLNERFPNYNSRLSSPTLPPSGALEVTEEV